MKDQPNIPLKNILMKDAIKACASIKNTTHPVTLTPITPSEDVMDVMEGDNGANGSDCAKMVAVSDAKTPWRENPYLPTQPRKLATEEQKEQFLTLLREYKYIVWAADKMGISPDTVERRMAQDQDFAAATHKIIAWREAKMLARIEAVSEAEAVKEGRNTDRAMQLNALAPGKYKRDAKGVQVATQVNIMLGLTPPKHKGT